MRKLKVCEPDPGGPDFLGLTDKMLLPDSTLKELLRLEFEFPLSFLATGLDRERSVACSVLQFTAPKGVVVMSRWLMENLELKTGSSVVVTATELPKGTLATFKPLSRDFYDLRDPKAELEKLLQNFGTLTKGTTVSGEDGLVFEVRDLEPGDFVAITNVDLGVEFAKPDFDFPPRAAKPSPTPVTSSPAEAEESGALGLPAVPAISSFAPDAPGGGGFVAFGGKGNSLNSAGDVPRRSCPGCGTPVPVASFDLHLATCRLAAGKKKRLRRLFQCGSCLKCFASSGALQQHSKGCGRPKGR